VIKKTDIPVCFPFEFLAEERQIRENMNSDNLPLREAAVTRRHLPHWRRPLATYWVTFRQADSLPISMVATWQKKKEEWERLNPQPWDSQQWDVFNLQFGNLYQEWLDAGMGSCVLADPEIRQIFIDCLLRFHRVRFNLHAAVVMPNHVHLIAEPYPDQTLSGILRGMKGASSRKINQVLGQTGETLWMEESYDQIIRSESQYRACLRYIFDNPRKAGLKEGRYWLFHEKTLTFGKGNR
jgi:putative transposase